MSYSCFNRRPLADRFVGQDGWWTDGYSRTAKAVSIRNPNTKVCQYSKDDKYADKDCVGCKHKETK